MRTLPDEQHKNEEINSARLAKNQGLGSHRTNKTLDVISQKVHAASKMLEKIASKKLTKVETRNIENMGEGTQKLYGQIVHQLSRKGDVKLSKNSLLLAGESPTEKTEVVLF